MPRKIAEVKRLIKNDKNELTRRDRMRQLEILQQQENTLKAGTHAIKRAEIHLESTLAALGTVYAQMSLLGTKDTGSTRGQRLSIEIKDEIDKLQDTIDAMDEVQFYSQRLNSDFLDALEQVDDINPNELRQRQRLSTDDESEVDELAAAGEEDSQLQSQR